MEALLRIVGRRIAAGWHMPPGNLHTRLEGAVDVLNELGGMAELELRDDTYSIHGYSCPLAAAVPGHPEICRLAETLLTELVGVPVQEQCERGEIAHCCFVVPSLKEDTNANTLTMRQRMEQHRANPACATCHKLMDPLGFALA